MSDVRYTQLARCKQQHLLNCVFFCFCVFVNIYLCFSVHLFVYVSVWLSVFVYVLFLSVKVKKGRRKHASNVLSSLTRAACRTAIACSLQTQAGAAAG